MSFSLCDVLLHWPSVRCQAGPICVCTDPLPGLFHSSSVKLIRRRKNPNGKAFDKWVDSTERDQCRAGPQINKGCCKCEALTSALHLMILLLSHICFYLANGALELIQRALQNNTIKCDFRFVWVYCFRVKHSCFLSLINFFFSLRCHLWVYVSVCKVNIKFYYIKRGILNQKYIFFLQCYLSI